MDKYIRITNSANSGAAVVLATPDPEVAAMCDAQIHLVDGRIVDTPMT